MHRGIVARAPGSDRPRLLPREIRGGGGGDHGYPGEHGEDAHVLCAQETGRASQESRRGKRLAMTAMTLGVGVMEPDDIEGLLPWHATGTLNTRDARRVDEALQRDPGLARQYAVIQEEIGETIHVNESLGAPSSGAMQKL